MGLAAAGAFARPSIANAAATTATMWVTQGFVAEEDAAYRAMVADYQKASGNTIDYSIIPFAALRQKAVSAVAAGVVPDMMEVLDFQFLYLNAWKNNLLDVTEIFDTQKQHYGESALASSFAYNNVGKKRSRYLVPWKTAAVPFHIWKSLVEKSGHKVADIPKTWDAFLGFFQARARRPEEARDAQHLCLGLSADRDRGRPDFPIQRLYDRLWRREIWSPRRISCRPAIPQVKEAAIKATEKLAKAFTAGYVPPVVLNWNDADDNNAFHAKLMVMDFDGSISTEVALYHNKEEYDDILTLGLPLGNDGRQLPAQTFCFGPVIPRGAKNISVATEFLKHAIEPKVLNQYLKAGLGRFVIPMPAMAKSDPFWLDPADPHREAYVEKLCSARRSRSSRRAIRAWRRSARKMS